MKFSSLAALGLATSLALTAHHASAGPELQIPDFSHLKQKAVESVDVTLDGFLMRLASKFAAADGDSDLAILKDIKSVEVRNFKFDADDAYSKSDIDSVRRQLNTPDWSALVQVHKRDAREDVDVFVCLQDGKVKGLAVIASEPREFTIVNVIGSFDLDKIAEVVGQLDVPNVNVNLNP